MWWLWLWLLSPLCLKRAGLRLVAVAPKAEDLFERVSVFTVNDGLPMGVFVLDRGLDDPMKDGATECGRCSRALCERGGTMLKMGVET